MKETPLLFNAPMVRAILDGSKTVTRRIVKLPHNNPLGQWEPTTIGGENGGRTASGEAVPLQGGIWHTRTGDCLSCPYGQPGDHLYVRETFVHIDDEGGKLDGMGSQTYYAASGDYEGNTQWLRKRGLKWTPSIHMPRWASRINLEITGVRVERLQDISEADALTEGITYGQLPDNQQDDAKARTWYRGLWETINGAGSWELNPWVWCVSFRRIAA